MADSVLNFEEMPQGAVSPRSNGECPKGHRVKGNQSMIYHSEGFPNYTQTIAELCFDCEKNAEKAGFRRPENVEGKASDATCISDQDADEARLLAIAIKEANGKTKSGKDLPKKSVPAFLSGGSGGDGGSGSGSGSGSDGSGGDRGELTCPRTHPVKGNESSYFYHVPGGAYYKMTIPEFCFKTVKDAVDAGFTAPSR
jgi:hypothetical protein